MDGAVQTLAAFLTALGAFVGALILAYRGLSSDRFSRKVSESAALLAGYTEMVKNLRIEIGEIRSDHDADIARHKKQHEEDMSRLSRLQKFELDSMITIYSEERKRWDAERNRMSKLIEELNERIDDLGSHVYFLQNRPPESRSREGDNI